MANKQLKNAISGLGQGLGAFEKVQARNEARNANRAVAQAKQDTQASLLKESQDRIARQPSVDQAQEKIDIEMNKLRADNEELTRNQDFKDINKALTDSDVNGEFSSLVNVLKTNKSFSGIYRNLAGIEPMNLSLDEDLRLLEPARKADGGKEGKPQNDIPQEFQAEDLESARQFWSERPELLKQQAKMLKTDGKKALMDIRAFKGRQGFFSDMNKDQLKTEINKVKLEKAQIELEGLRNPEAQKGKPGAFEKTSQFIAETTGRPLKDIVSERNQSDIAGTSPGKTAIANKATDDLYTKFGGEDGFFETDFSNPKNRRKALRDIRKIESSIGGLDSKVKTRLTDIGKLIGLAETSSNLTKDSAGLVDNFTNRISQFIRSDVVDADRQAAEAALLQFQALVRNNIYGSALTSGEASLNAEAVGTLNEQLPSVLIKFREQIQQLSDDISTVGNLEDPVLAKFYIGADQNEVDAIIDRLDDSLVLLGANPEPKKTKTPSKTSTTKPVQSSTPARTTAEEDFNALFGGQ